MSLNVPRPKVRSLWFLLMNVALIMAGSKVSLAADYYRSRSLGKHLMSLAEQHPELVRLESIARSIGRRNVWLIEVGRGAKHERKTRPAMLVVAGVEGNDLIGCSTAVSWVEYLVEQYGSDAGVTRLLKTTAVYIIPRLNPDAAEYFFARPKLEMSLNKKPADDDHDGLIDEDGPEDIDGDGLITWMRVEDIEGEYILDPKDDRLLMKADHLKGEVGKWRYLTEGTDNDKDERWNEDGPGGVNFNRNFPYDFKFFGADAGLHPVSEAETRAIADFVVEHPNVGIVVTYGDADNLSKTPKGARLVSRRKPMTAIDADDVGYYRAMGEIYREALGLDKELEGASADGSFSDWMYYHRGRLSLAARAWSPAAAIELSKAAEKKEDANYESDKSRKSRGDDDKRNEKERKELKWFDENAAKAFVKWRPVEHLDFPNQRVEVGGYVPFALTNPPAEIVEQIAAKHANFLTSAAQRLPRIGIRKIGTRHLGRSVYEVRIEVENTGFLPTSLAQGRTTREVHPTRLLVDLDDRYFLSGARFTTLPTIRGSGGVVEARYTIKAPDRKKIGFEVVSMLGGRVDGTIELPDAG